MPQVGRNIERKAVERHPAPDTNADRADLCLASVRVVGPDADPAVGAARLDSQIGKRVDNPALERRDKGAHVAPAPCKVELDIADALPRSVVGIAPAAPGVINRKAAVEQFGGVGARPCGIERRVLEEPDALARAVGADRSGAALHIGERRPIIGQPFGNGPFRGRKRVHGAGLLPCCRARRKGRRERLQTGVDRWAIARHPHAKSGH